MHSLYWRIFLAFWVALALILVGTVTVAVNATAHRTDRPWVQRGQLYAQAARAFESGGPEALKSWLQSLPAEPFGRTFVVDPGGRELLGRPLPPPLSGSRDAAAASGGAIAPIGGALGWSQRAAAPTTSSSVRCAAARVSSVSWSCRACR